MDKDGQENLSLLSHVQSIKLDFLHYFTKKTEKKCGRN